MAAGCREWMCGSNSPEIDERGLHELNLHGLPNAEGFRLKKVDKGGAAYTMSVIGGAIHLTPVDGGSDLANEAVRDAILHVIHDPTGTNYDLRIAGVDKTLSWATRADGTHDTMRTYLIEWTAPDDPLNKKWANVCSNPGASSTLGMDTYHSVVFEGDRIDADTKVVNGVDLAWFNIGCAGHTLAKMHLSGHTEGGHAHGFSTTPAERTTMLKMLSGDYCGTGKPFTVAGVDLTWADNHDSMNFTPATASLEARWTPSGAACLNKPRLEANPTELGDAMFPGDVRKLIENTCGDIPTCSWIVPRGTSYHLVSGNP